MFEAFGGFVSFQSYFQITFEFDEIDFGVGVPENFADAFDVIFFGLKLKVPDIGENQTGQVAFGDFFEDFAAEEAHQAVIGGRAEIEKREDQFDGHVVVEEF